MSFEIQYSEGIQIGYIAPQSDIKLWTGKVYPQTMKNLAPVGDRIMVLQDDAPDSYGTGDDGKPLIYVAPMSTEAEDMYRPKAGTIVAVGQVAGMLQQTYPGGLQVDHPEALLGLRVYFPPNCGMPFRSDMGGRSEFKSLTLLMSTHDVQLWDTVNSPRFRKLEEQVGYEGS